MRPRGVEASPVFGDHLSQIILWSGPAQASRNRRERCNAGDNGIQLLAPSQPERCNPALPSEERPGTTTLYRWLRRAVEKGLLRQDGRGQRHQPFRYRLAENERRWRQDPLALVHMPELVFPQTDLIGQETDQGVEDAPGT